MLDAKYERAHIQFSPAPLDSGVIMQLKHFVERGKKYSIDASAVFFNFFRKQLSQLS